ncbi:MAG TPA: ketopantoate reductase family protein [Dehalococcoidia bacterium]|jgi:2-dehydropantoate 2-reductase|nr:ketopantoate reductase family protein [Dehalococcoidia bacterium]
MVNNQFKKIAIMGSGAVGTYFGSMLSNAGLDVVLIARGEHLEALKSSGASVKSSWGNFVIPIKATDSPQFVGEVDLVLFCVKTYSNKSAIKAMRSLIGTETSILTIQNGISSGDQLSKEYENVFEGATYIEVSRDKPGSVFQTGETALIRFGNRNNVSEKMNIIKETLSVKGIQIEISTDIESVLWSKLILVGSVGTLMASTRSSFLEIIESPYGLSVCEKMMSEIFLAAQSKNVSLPSNLIEQNIQYLLKDKDNIQSSLQQDLFSGKPLELDDLMGEALRIGKRNQIEMPVSESLYTSLYNSIRGK